MHARISALPLAALLGCLGIAAGADAVILDVSADPFVFVIDPCTESGCARTTAPPVKIHDLSGADNVSLSAPSGTRFGPFAMTAEADTDTLLVENFAFSNTPASFLVSVTHDYGLVTATIDPAGFDPPFEATFDITLEASFSLSFQLQEFLSIPIQPDTLHTNTFVPFALVEETHLTFTIDGTPVSFEHSSRIDQEVRIFFTDDPAPAVTQIQFQEIQAFGTYDVLIAGVGQGIAAYVGEPAQVTATENQLSGPLIVDLPEPTTWALLLGGLGIGLIRARGRQRTTR